MKRGAYYLHKKKIEGRAVKPKSRFEAVINKIVLFIAIVAPLFEIPQLLEIYVNKSAQDVSLITWGFFSLMAIPWFIYGVIHKEKPIMILYALWFLIDTVIVIGILIYG